MMQGLSLFLLLQLLFTGVIVNSQAPTCTDGESCQERTCQLYQWRDDLVSGVNLERGESFPEGMSSDVVIPVQFHATHWIMWNRYIYWHEVEANKTQKLLFAPGLTMPVWRCHKKLNNIQAARTATEQISETTIQEYFNDDTNNDVNTPQEKEEQVHMGIEDHRELKENLNIPANFLDKNYYTASFSINAGDPLFLPCKNDDMSEDDAEITSFPWFQRFPTPDMTCIDTIYSGVSQSIIDTTTNEMGAFTKFAFKRGQTIQSSELVHIHRSELYDKKKDQYELLLNYCFGVEKSSLLLLPTGRMVNYINHASGDDRQPNVGVRWKKRRLEIEYFFKDIDNLFSEEEEAHLEIEYYALRDLQPDEELLLDYGLAWQRAYDEHEGKQQPFRHEIRLPPSMFPQTWLDHQQEQDNKNTEPSLPSWSVRQLQAGEVEQLTVKETGETPAKYLYRVGLGPDLSRKMLEYANQQGITEIMKHHVNHRPLEKNGTEHYRINGGVWWLKRFDKGWRSNMHYITPDDPIANADFLSALSDAGFDKVLEGLGKHFGMEGLECWYPSFIAVSHCTTTMLHSDAEKSDGKAWNVIFPVLQVTEEKPELMLGFDEPNRTVLPYRYEPEHAAALGDDGMHGTAPCDYRGDPKKLRMVISVYMADTNQKNFKWVMWHEDPPYPPYQHRPEFLWRNRGRDWNAQDPNQKLPTREYFQSVLERRGNLYNQTTGYYY